jgi:hypothetical protein
MRGPVAGDVDPAREPDALMAGGVVDEAPERHDPAGPADQAAVEAHGHHPPAFGIERVEAVAQIGLELVARVEALGRGEAHVVGVERVGDDELVAPARPDPVGQVVGVAVGDVVEAALLGDEADGVHRAAPEVPAARARAGHLGVEADGLGQMRAFLGLGHVAVFDPLQPVAGDLPAGLGHGGDLFGVPSERGGDAVDRGGDPLFGEEPVQAPEACARAVFVHRLHVPVALPGPGLGTDDLGQEGLGGGIAVKQAVLAAFLVVDHELDGDAGASGPGSVGRMCPVSGQVAGVAGGRRHLGLPCHPLPA